MTFEELRNFIHDHYISSLPSATIDKHINNVYKDLTRVFTPDFPEAETVSTISGQETVVMTENARSVKMVFIGDNGDNGNGENGSSLEITVYGYLDPV